MDVKLLKGRLCFVHALGMGWNTVASLEARAPGSMVTQLLLLPIILLWVKNRDAAWTDFERVKLPPMQFNKSQ